MKKIISILISVILLLSFTGCSAFVDGFIEGVNEAVQDDNSTADIVLESEDVSTGAVFVGSVDTIRDNFSKYSEKDFPSLSPSTSDDGKFTYLIFSSDIGIENANILIQETSDRHVEAITVMAFDTISKDDANFVLEYCANMAQALGVASAPKAISDLVKEQKKDIGSTYGCTEDYTGYILTTKGDEESFSFFYFGIKAMKGKKAEIQKYEQ